MINWNCQYYLYNETLKGAEEPQLFRIYQPAIFTLVCKDSPKPLDEVYGGMSGAGLDRFLLKNSKYLRILRADLQSL